MKINKLLVAGIVAVSVLTSCSEDATPETPKGDYDNGIIIGNEGAFSGGTGTINFISDDYKTEEAKVFNKVNNENVGGVLQSITFNNGDAYLIANVGNRVILTNRYTMEKKGEITKDLVNPRYMAIKNNKGYISNWGDSSVPTDDYIAVVDLSTNTIEKKISVPAIPEQVKISGDKLYVTHSWGGNYVSVIDLTTDKVLKKLEVGSNPDEIIELSNGNLLVSCEGASVTQWNPTEVLASFVVINPSNDEFTSVELPAATHPNAIVNENGQLYFTANNVVYTMSETSSTYAGSELVNPDVTTSYGLSVNNGKLYITDAKDYASNGALKVISIADKKVEKEFTMGLIPSKIYFNN